LIDLLLKPFSDKLKIIKKLMHKKKVLVAISGGVDSTLVLLLAIKYAEKVIPVFFNAPIFSKHEMGFARELCLALKIQLEIVEFNPLENHEFKSNPPDRCYICKKLIMGNMVKIREEIEFDEIIEGTNVSELQNEIERPGYRALKELKIQSPLIDGNFKKEEIRELIGYIGNNISSFLGKDLINEELAPLLDLIRNKPSSPCLCSRIEFHLGIDPVMLEKIDEAEHFLKKKFDLINCRVRLHRNLLARIEVPVERLKDISNYKTFKTIVEKFKELGFKYVTLDLEGFRSGSLN
jgi:uncharacterized protein